MRSRAQNMDMRRSMSSPRSASSSRTKRREWCVCGRIELVAEDEEEEEEEAGDGGRAAFFW